MTETTLLYVLSTLAQTCAALAAFVGAVGLFRLQVLRERHAVEEREVRAWVGLARGADYSRIPPLEEVLNMIEESEKAGNKSPHLKTAKEARARWERVPDLIRRSRRALRAFEVWNLLVIVASLVGFNYSEWAGAPWPCRVLGLVAMSTALITVGSVWVWTRGVET